mgnify:CR=1 FL=1
MFHNHGLKLFLWGDINVVVVVSSDKWVVVLLFVWDGVLIVVNIVVDDIIVTIIDITIDITIVITIIKPLPMQHYIAI